MLLLRQFCLVTALLGFGVANAQAPRELPKPEVHTAIAKTDRVVPTKLDTAKFSPQIKHVFREREREIENPQWPDWMFKTHPDNKLPVGKADLPNLAKVQSNFPAIGATGWVPADPSLAVGQNHVVVVVNCSVAWYKRDGTPQFEQTFQDFFAGTGAGSFIFDPKAFYDRTSSRYFFCALEADFNTRVSKLLVAVSDDADPNGTWYRYRFDTRVQAPGVDAWLDYPGFGYNKDAIVGTGNLFGFDSGFYGVLFMTAAKAPMLTGAATTARYIIDGNAATAQMSQIWSPTETRLFGVNRQDTATAKIHAIENPASANPVLKSAYVAFPNYSWPSNSATSNPGFLDVLDTRFYNANFRNGRLTTAHSVRHSSTQNKVRWYEFNMNNWPTSGAPTLVQSGEVAPTDSATHFHMPAIGQNSQGEITTLFTRSSATAPADLMFSTRMGTDPLGSMGFPQLLKNSDGTTYGGAGVNRWGDYFDVNIDPIDDTTFWGVGMVGDAVGNWRTHVFSWTATVAIPLQAMNVSPTEILAGTDTINLEMFLLNKAPKTGMQVNLAATDPAIITTPSPKFGANQWRMNVTVKSNQVESTRNVTISASTAGTPAKSVTVRLRPRRIDLTSKLGGLVPSTNGRSVTLTLRSVGTTNAIETRNMVLNAKAYSGYYIERVGTFDAAIYAPGYLRKVVRISIPQSGPVPINIGLLGGDADRDNDVDNDDLRLVQSQLNQVGVNGDVDGDGTVTTKDIALVRSNLGKKGDQ